MKSIKKWLIYFFLINSTNAFSQIDNSAFSKFIVPDSTKSKSLELSIYSFNYQRNYEYFNKFADGITFYGTQNIPSLTFYSNENVAINAGVLIRKDFGFDGINDVLPVFSIIYQKNNLKLINGVLQGTTDHNYLEILYDQDRKIVDPLEYGTQFIADKEYFYTDFWINWEKMIYKPSSDQEEINGGLSSRIKPFKSANNKLEFPLQAIAFHRGGQIDTLNEPIQTRLNTALGIEFTSSGKNFINQYQFSVFHLYQKLFSPFPYQIFPNGNGFNANAKIRTNYFELYATYFRGNGFQSILGSPVYQSVSIKIDNEAYFLKERELLILRLIGNINLSKNLILSSRFEPYFDLNKKSAFQFSNSLFLIFKQDFFLSKIKS